MGKHQVIRIELSQPMIRLIDGAVASGDYGSSTDVVRAALDAWSSSRLPVAHDDTHLMKMLQLGIDSGPSIPGDEVFAELEARYSDDADT